MPLFIAFLFFVSLLGSMLLSPVTLNSHRIRRRNVVDLTPFIDTSHDEC